MARKFKLPKAKHKGHLGGKGFLTKPLKEQERLVHVEERRHGGGRHGRRVVMGELNALKVRNKNRCPKCGKKIDDIISHMGKCCPTLGLT